MKEEIQRIAEIVNGQQIPKSFDETFGSIYDTEHQQFTLQENIIIDYKENFPSSKDLDYRSGLLKLMAAFHNSYGGIIIFGVRNDDFKPVGVDQEFDIEKYNSLFSDLFESPLEMIKRNFFLPVDGEVIKITSILIPRRTKLEPVASNRSYGQIREGSIFVRERHEAITATGRNFPRLFSRRTDILEELGDEISGLQFSAPPPPSTLPTFIGRDGLALKLWKWLLLDRKPRIYLSGPGGSGKSTLAYEFMEQVAQGWKDLYLRNGERADFVAFFSAKETELNVKTATEQSFSLRQFQDSTELFKLILSSVGAYHASEIKDCSRDELMEKIEGIFCDFNGILIIDDIDALSRAGLDTGEEELFLLASQARKSVRIIYTLRNDATYAKNAAIAVPGLDPESEVPPFIEACCKMFETDPPNAVQTENIIRESACLPLLIETIVGLKTNGSSYEQAIRDFRDKGGDAARSYLYQREYEKLSDSGKSRQVLAALMEYNGALNFDTICALINSSNAESIRHAINETANIFLKVSSLDDGTTAYSLTPSAYSFVRSYSKRLPYYPALVRAVEHFRKETAASTPREASIISICERLIRAKQFDEIISFSNELEENDTVRVNPKFMSLLGQSHVRAKHIDLIKARELFKSAQSFGYDDIFMLRAWYHAEKNSGYRLNEAIDVCKIVADNQKFSARHRSEFYAKIGECKSAQARGIQGKNNPDRTSLYANAAVHYAWAMHFASSTEEIDRAKTLDWFIRALQNYVNDSAGDFNVFVNSLERSIRTGLTFSKETSNAVAAQLVAASRSKDHRLLRKFQATLNSGIATIIRFSGKANRPNVIHFIESLEIGKKAFEVRIMQLSNRT